MYNRKYNRKCKIILWREDENSFFIWDDKKRIEIILLFKINKDVWDE